jgi:transcriptional regulator with XRE-family HTH domain
MPKAATATKTADKKRAQADVVQHDEDIDRGDSSGGAYFEIQRPLIHLVEEYLLTHPVAGKRMTLKAFCERAGITVANMTAIINGNRWVAKCNRDTIEKLATALEVPVLQIYILSGFITTRDVVSTSSIDETLDAIYRQMARDKRMTYRVPTEAEWRKWPQSAKLSMCMMYEAFIERVLLRYATSA